MTRTRRRADENVIGDLGVYGAWADICARYGVHVHVDVIAGSSAGGLNGTFLATAIARGAPLPPLQAVWADLAQMDTENLLWPRDTDYAPSILDGDRMLERIHEILDTIHARPQREDVTLFVTATALGEQPRTLTDSAGARFTTQDHRRLYRFARETRRVYHCPTAGTPLALHALFTGPAGLDGEADTADAFRTSAALARAARASTSFPVAFAPVPDRSVADQPATVLTDLDDPAAGAAWLMDGGVLDNAPFGPVLDDVARRPVDKPWRRALVYVVPSVDTIGTLGPTDEAPGWWRVVTSALALPREVDLRADVERVQQLAADADRWGGGPQRLFAQLRELPESGRREHQDAARVLFPSYRQARLDGGVTDALQQWARQRPEAPITPRTLRQRDGRGAIGWIPLSFAEIDSADESWPWGTAVADRVLRMMLRDIAGRSTPTSPAGRERHERALQRLSDALANLAAVRDAIEAHLRDAVPQVTTAERALDAINAAIRDLRVPEVVAALVADGARAYVSVQVEEADAGRSADPAPAARARTAVADALIVEVLTGAYTADRAFRRPVNFDFYRFGPDVDTPLVDVASPSAPDQELPLGPWKLWGTHLGHFGAFGRREWREHDWLWGRLDGAAHLVRLIAAESAAATGGDGSSTVDVEADVRTIQQAILAAHRKSTAELHDAAAHMATVRTGALLASWRHDEAGRDSFSQLVGSVFRVLRTGGEGTPAPVTTLGRWLSVALAEDLPADLHDEWSERILRLLARALGVPAHWDDVIDRLTDAGEERTGAVSVTPSRTEVGGTRTTDVSSAASRPRC